MTYSTIIRSLRRVTYPLTTVCLFAACGGTDGDSGAASSVGGVSFGNGGATSLINNGTGNVINGSGGANANNSNSTVKHTGGSINVGSGGKTASIPPGTGGVTPAGGSPSTGGNKATGGSPSSSGCTDTPRSSETCAQAKEWGFCDKDWFIQGGYCKATCGSCSSAGAGGNKGAGGNPSTGGTKATGGSPSTGGTKATGGTTSGGGVTVPRLTNGKDGKTTRYWDCCKPSCGWSANAAQNGKKPTKTCGNDGASAVGADTKSSCEGGGGFQCYNFAPWSVSDTLSYGFAATGGGNGNCGKCYQLDFTGTGDNTNASALSNKTMIVQAVNIGGDVSAEQFDLLIPGGGVGAFNACSNQWSASDLGAQYGGFLTSCNYTNMTCVNDYCKRIFGSKPDLLAGCNWFTGWFNGANNPRIKYAEVTCPQAISAKSGM